MNGRPGRRRRTSRCPAGDGQHVGPARAVGVGVGPGRLADAQQLGQHLRQRARLGAQPRRQRQRAGGLVDQLVRAGRDHGGADAARLAQRAAQRLGVGAAGRHVHEELVHHPVGVELDRQAQDVGAAPGQRGGEQGETARSVVDLGADAQQRHGTFPRVGGRKASPGTMARPCYGTATSS
ncbi:hypothetical protein ACQEU3_33585 [Spirillospora sp. CA-253888]